MDNSREFFLATFKAELPAFERVLNAVPEGKLDYRPHPKSRSAMELIMSWAGNPMSMVEIMEKGTVGNGDGPITMPKSLGEVKTAFKGGSEMVQKKTKAVSADDWDKPAKMYMDGKEVWSTTRGAMIWGILLDWIHHRGQLSTYLRPMGGKVPSIYGPSGDDPGTMM